MLNARKPLLWGLVAVAALFAVPARGAEVENPEYKMWSKYKAGTLVKTKMATPQSDVEQTVTLVSVAADKLVLETKMVIVAAGQKIDTPAQNRDVLAKIDLPAQPAGENKDAPKLDIKTGEETLKIGGKDVKTKWTESKMKIADKTMVSKVWRSDEIPTLVAKSVSNTEGGDASSATSMTVTEFVVK